MIFYLIYNFLLLVLFPLILWMLYKPKADAPSFGWRWIEHFGFVAKAESGFDLWIHAVSVGESNAAIPIIKKLLAERPNLRILVTTTTSTGHERIETQLSGQVTHYYAPVDLWPCVQLFLKRSKPKTLLIMETELWPNLLAACNKKAIPTVLVNARLSARSAKRYAQFSFFSKALFTQLDAVLAQYQSDAERFISLGIDRGKVHITGSVKFDFEPASNIRIQGQSLRQSFGGQRDVLIAASTRDKEEALVLKAFKLVLKNRPNALLILVPRHPQRFEEVYNLCLAQGFTVARRSKADSLGAHTHIFLGDTMGELALFYASSDLAFIGGSLVPLGGQNMLEPAAIGIPCLMGPSVYNFSDISQKLIAAGGLKLCSDYHDLAQSMIRLFEQPELRLKMAHAARQAVSNNRGAVSNTVRLLQVYLPNN